MNSQITEKTLLSLQEALEYLKEHYAEISESLLRGAIAKGEISYIRPGGKLFKFKKEFLDNWIKNQTFEAKPQTQA